MRWDAKKRRYVDSHGHVIPASEVRREVIDYVDTEKEKTQKQAGKLLAETITAAAFFHFMSSKVKAWHDVAGSIAYGGKAQMDREREGRIKAKIDSELTYLKGFKQEVRDSFSAARAAELTITESDIAGSIANRAGMYADALYSTFVNSEAARERDFGVTMARRICEEDDNSCEECISAATEDFVEWADLPEIGSLQCMNNCRCEMEYDVSSAQFTDTELLSGGVQDAFGGSVDVQ